MEYQMTNSQIIGFLLYNVMEFVFASSRLLFSVKRSHVMLYEYKYTDVSDEHTASILRVKC
jgi:hypothetical protein